MPVRIWLPLPIYMANKFMYGCKSCNLSAKAYRRLSTLAEASWQLRVHGQEIKGTEEGKQLIAIADKIYELLKKKYIPCIFQHD